MSKKLTTEEFIEKARKVHGDKYDYTRVEYIGSKIKVKIICPIHGEFEQIPNSHLLGFNCPKCGNKKRRENCVMTQNDFIERARLVHGDKYDYSKVEYINSDTKVCIICPIHGEFWQTPCHHINRGDGCQKCANKNNNIDKRSNTVEFIEKARRVHGNKYDYSQVEYVNNHSKICIICPTHGVFMQTPTKHIHGLNGCPKCKESKLEREVGLFLTSNNIKFERQKKFSWLGQQLLDFYLTDYHIGVECQGRQHFEIVDAFGSVEGYEVMLERDERKLGKCLDNGVRVIYYTEERFKKYINKDLIYTQENTIINLEDLIRIIK